MRITITEVQDDMMLLGYTPMPSFGVKFTSPSCSGQARFVPADTEGDHVGQVYDVEINQEAVSDFSVINANDGTESVVALAEPAAFRVNGTVVELYPAAQPRGEFFMTVRAGDARFMLSQADVCMLPPKTGVSVCFNVHRVSLWDEAI